MSDTLGNFVHLGERVEDKPKDKKLVVFGSLGGGMSYNFNLFNIVDADKNIRTTDSKGELFKCYDSVVIDPKDVDIKNSWNPLKEESGPEGLCSALKNLGFDEKRQELYLALAGLVRYGGFIEDPDRNLAMMNSLEKRPLEELDKIFQDEHRSGKLPVFFYEHWKKYRSSITSDTEAGD